MPVIETDRLRLRGFRRSDFDPYCAILDKPEVHAFLGPRRGRGEIWMRALSGLGQWEALGYGGLMVERRADERLLGNVSLFEAIRDLGFEGEPELGYILDSEVHGQGYGSEAVRALLDWAEANLAPTPIWAIIDPENPPSQRLASKFGFVRETRKQYEDGTVDVMKRPAW